MKHLNCVEKFKMERRRSEREQLKAIQRKQLISWLSKHLLTSQFNNISYSEPILSLDTIVQNCQDILTSPLPLDDGLMDDNISMIQLDSHINLYIEILKQKSHENSMLQNLSRMVLQITRKYKCLHIHEYPEYQQQFYRIISLVGSNIQISKKLLLYQWAQIIESFDFIGKIIQQQDGVDCENCPNLFRIIQSELKSQVRQNQDKAVIVLAKIIEVKEQIGTYLIHDNFFEIACSIGKIIYSRLRLEQFDVLDFSKALIYLLQTFNEAIISYANKIEFIDICELLIETKCSSHIDAALNILNILWQVDDQKMTKQLQKHKNMKWMQPCIENNVFSHPDDTIRKNFIKLVKYIAKLSKIEFLEQFISIFKAEKKNFLKILRQWLYQYDCDIVDEAKQCIQSLFHCKKYMDTNYYKTFMDNVDNYNMLDYIRGLYNEEQSQDQIDESEYNYPFDFLGFFDNNNPYTHTDIAQLDQSAKPATNQKIQTITNQPICNKQLNNLDEVDDLQEYEAYLEKQRSL